MLRLVIETFLFLFFAPFVFDFKVGTSNASSNALISSEYHETHKVKLVVDFSASYDRAANNGQQVAGHDDRPNIF